MDNVPVTHCLSCNTPLNGLPFCGSCGQRNVHAQLNWRNLLEDLNTQLLELNLPWLYTIRELTLRPGRVALNYIHGDRVRYVNPLKYLVYISALVTFLLSLTPEFDLLSLRVFSEDRVLQVSPVARFFLFNIAVFVLIMSPIPVFLLRIVFWNTSRNKTEIACLVFFLQGHGLLIFYCLTGLLPYILNVAGIWESITLEVRISILLGIPFVIFPVYAALTATVFFETKWYWSLFAVIVVTFIYVFASLLFHQVIWSLLALGRIQF